jgi:hypothetical protein
MRMKAHFVLCAFLCIAGMGRAQTFHPDIPRAWDNKEAQRFELPLVQRDRSPRYMTAEQYYALKVRPIYRSHPAYANCRGPAGYLVLLDTGSQTNHIDSRLARKLELHATLKTGLYTPSGQAIVDAGRVSKVSLGSMEAIDQEFLFISFDGQNTLPQDIQRILGQEFLAHFDDTLDLQHDRLPAEHPPARGAPIRAGLSSSGWRYPRAWDLLG